jgi:hypothetical protein
MAIVYLKRATDSDLTGVGLTNVDFSKDLIAGAAGSSTEFQVSVASGGAEFRTLAFYTEAGEPASGGSGSQSFGATEVRVITGNTSGQISVRRHRVNSSGTIQASGAFTAEQQANAGVLTFAAQSIDLGTWAAGDRYLVEVRVRNSSAHGGAITVGIGTETTDDEDTAPWSAVQIVTVGQAVETDLAQPIVRNPVNLLIGQVTETDLAQAITNPAADVTIDSTISTSTGRGMRSEVWHPTDPDIGYRFYIDNDPPNASLAYAKTTDGGVSWGSPVHLNASDPVIAYDVWADWWTPGDTGTLIHTTRFTSTADDLFYRTVDIADGDALGTDRVVSTETSLTSAIGAHISIVKAVGGNLYVSGRDGSGEGGCFRSVDGGVNWTSRASPIEVTNDWAMLFPANLADTQDIWAVYFDASTNELTLKAYDNSADSWSESAVIVSIIESAADLFGQYPFSASIRHSDGHLFIVAITNIGAVNNDFRTFDVNGTGSITEKTAIATDIANIAYPSVFIDQNTDSVYVAYNGKRDDSESLLTATKVYYTKSTDGGANWSAGDTKYMYGAAGVVIQTWAPLMGPRFHVSWRVNQTLLGNAASSVTFAGAQTIAVAQVVETDLAQTVGRLKAKALDQLVEIDSAQEVSSPTIVTVAQIVETDLAQAIVWAPQHRLAVQASETDLAQAIIVGKVLALAQASEANAAQGVTHPAVVPVAQAAEADVAQSVEWAPQHRLAAQAIETDAAQAISRVKAQTVVQATETNLAQSASAGKIVAVGQSVETDAAQSVTALRTVPIAQAAETDLAQAVAASKARAVAQAAEIDLSQTVTFTGPTPVVNPAQEFDIAPAVAVAKARSIGQAAEVDAVQSILPSKLWLLGIVSEVDVAQAVGKAKVRALSQAEEFSFAQAVATGKLRVVATVSEANAAFPIGKTVGIGQAFEVDLAHAIALFIPPADTSEFRLYQIAAEGRLYAVAADGRVYLVEAEDRAVLIVDENREQTVGG